MPAILEISRRRGFEHTRWLVAQNPVLDASRRQSCWRTMKRLSRILASTRKLTGVPLGETGASFRPAEPRTRAQDDFGQVRLIFHPLIRNEGGHCCDVIFLGSYYGFRFVRQQRRLYAQVLSHPQGTLAGVLHTVSVLNSNTSNTAPPTCRHGTDGPKVGAALLVVIDEEEHLCSPLCLTHISRVLVAQPGHPEVPFFHMMTFSIGIYTRVASSSSPPSPSISYLECLRLSCRRELKDLKDATHARLAVAHAQEKERTLLRLRRSLSRGTGHSVGGLRESLWEEAQQKRTRCVRLSRGARSGIRRAIKAG